MRTALVFVLQSRFGQDSFAKSASFLSDEVLAHEISGW